MKDLLLEALGGSGKGSNGGSEKGSKDSNGGSGGGGPLSGMKGLAAGAGAAALVPLALKNLGNIGKALGIEGLEPGKALQGLTSNVGDSVGSGLGDKVSDKVDQEGGAAGILGDTVKEALPFGGGGGGSKGGVEGVGKGRRMPVQQSIDIGIPIESVYNQWTQFEDWPTFMHRVTRVTQEDDCTVSFAAKIWGKTKDFTAKIETQRPNERIMWKVSQGMTHTGVVTFHELGPNLTRVMLSFDVQPGSLIEKAARGMRHVKRAARADLHRFKALIETAEQETGAWRGVIEEGELVEEHDPSYDEDREYGDIDDLVQDSDEDEDEESEDDEEGEGTSDEQGEDTDDEEDDDQPQSQRRRRSGSDNGQQRQGRSRRSSGSSDGSRASSEGSGARSRTSRQGRRSGSSSSSSGSRSGSSRSGGRSGSSGGSSRGRSGSSGGSSKRGSSQRSTRARASKS
jgi:uncharacterized membrane protein